MNIKTKLPSIGFILIISSFFFLILFISWGTSIPSHVKASIYEQEGHKAFADGNIDLALTSFEKSTKIKDDTDKQARRYKHLSTVLITQENLEESLEASYQSLFLNPNDSEVYTRVNFLLLSDQIDEEIRNSYKEKIINIEDVKIELMK